MIAIELYQRTARCHARELFQQQTTLAPAAQAKLADKLLVANAVAGRALKASQNLTVGMCVWMAGHVSSIEPTSSGYAAMQRIQTSMRESWKSPQCEMSEVHW